MKLMINIPDEAYELLKSKSELDNIAESIIANGTPISTEGDLISRSEAEKLGATCLAKRNENGQLEAIISLDNAPTVELFCAYLSDGEVREPCVESPCKHEKPQGDLIIRSELKKAFDKWWGCDDIPATVVEDIIDNAPKVDLWKMRQEATENALKKAEVLYKRPQGEWIDYDNTFYKCPECGYLLEKCCPQCQNKVILPKGGAE